MASPNTKRDVSKSYSDLYNTPVEALDALFEYADIDMEEGIYFEPCAGKNIISDYVLENFGRRMITNELFEHGVSDYQEDFLNPNPLAAESWNFDTIISNPPYKLAQQFVEEGFKYAKDQYLLLRINFLEGKTRLKELYSQKKLKNVYVFSGRISCSKGVEEEKQPNAVCYCWYHFDREYNGQPTLHWL